MNNLLVNELNNPNISANSLTTNNLTINNNLIIPPIVFDFQNPPAGGIPVNTPVTLLRSTAQGTAGLGNGIYGGQIKILTNISIGNTVTVTLVLYSVNNGQSAAASSLVFTGGNTFGATVTLLWVSPENNTTTNVGGWVVISRGSSANQGSNAVADLANIINQI